jgi:hypothetical protein
MTEHESVGAELANGAKVLAIHLLAIAAGLVLMIAGLGMGVSVVLLPIGVPVGLFGLLAFIWGLFGWAEGKKASTQPPSPQ